MTPLPEVFDARLPPGNERWWIVVMADPASPGLVRLDWDERTGAVERW